MIHRRPGWVGVTLLLLALAPALPAQTYQNVSNRPWEAVSNGPQEAIVVDVDGVAPARIHQVVAERVRAVQRAMTQAAAPQIRFLKDRGLMPRDLPWPVTHVVILRQGGKLLLPPRPTGVQAAGGTGITLQFSTAQGETFDPDYRQVLQNAFDDTRAAFDAIYGQPYADATVLVVNYDTQIGDRDAVVGGIFLPSDPAHGGQPTILFPVYNSFAPAAVNFINLIAHAYHGSVTFDFDAWEQGFSRAATMKVARQVYPDTAPFGDGSTAGLVLDATYEGRFFYDWWNQPSLGNNSFIAPSLKQAPIPPGFTGGLFLVRYMMAGAAWAKVLTERPDFFVQFHNRYYADPDPKNNLAGNVPALVRMATDALGDGGNPTTVEGLEFATWFRRQHILDSSVRVGRKLHTQVIPLCFGLQTGETGVYILLYNYFTTDKTGDEALLSGVAFPIYWTFDFARMNLGAQYERADIQGGSAGLAPSFTENSQVITIDTPVAEVNSRVVLPLGTVCRQSFTNNLFGTVTGLGEAEPQTGKNGKVRITLLSGSFEADVIRGAFGLAAPADDLRDPQRATIEVFDPQDVLIGAFLRNIGPETAAFSLEVQDPGATVIRSYPKGIQMVSLPIRPHATDAAEAFGVPPDQFLFARWRQDLFRYAFYPSTPPIEPGYAFFLKLQNPMQDVHVTGLRPPPSLAYAVPLQVGWNQVGNPLLTTGNTPLTDVWVQKGPDDPAIGWSEAAAKGMVSQTVFRFDQNISNPDAGTPVPAFEFAAFRGYWVRVFAPEGVTILFRPSTGLGPRAPYAPPAPPGWQVRLALRTEDGDHAAAYFGAAPGGGDGFDPALDTELPPAFASGLQMAFGNLFRDVRAEGAEHEWTLRVTGLQPGQEYTLEWPALSTLKRELSLILSDPATGRSVNMRARPTFTFVADGVSKELRIVSRPRVYAGLRVTGLAINPTRGGAGAVFSLTQEATVSVRVTAVSGRAVRTLKTAAPLASGMHTVVWDGRDEQGVNLPPGQYMLSVEAVAEDGTVARAVRPMVLTR